MKRIDGYFWLKSVIALLSMPFGILWNGYALTVLWGWFVVDIFDLPGIGLFQGTGLYIIMAFLTKQWIAFDAQSDDCGLLCRHITSIYVRPAVFLLFGYLAVSFM